MSKLMQRFYDNPYGDSPKLMGADGLRKVLHAAGTALKAVKAAAKAHSDISGGAVYVGIGGIALTYLRLAQQLNRCFVYAHSKYLKKHTVESALNLAEAFAADAEALLPQQRRVTFLEGYSGALALRAVVLAARGDAAGANAAVRALEGYAGTATAVLGPGECELLYGRAGYLWSLLFVERQLGAAGAVSPAVVQELVSHLLQQGMEGARIAAGSSSSDAGRWGLMYSWHDKQYLGAAHGLCGIVYVLLHCLPQVRAAEPSGSGVAALTSACDALASGAFPSGNLPSSVGSKEDRLVQWCHGAPGLISTLLKAEEVLGSSDGRYVAAARKAARVVWHRGLLTKGVGLCHGISGNGYALLSLYRATRDESYLAQAQAFALFAAAHWEELYDTPDRPASLYEGLAGAVNFWLDVVDPQNARMPGWEL